MKKSIYLLSMAALLISVSGCVTAGDRMSDEEKIQATMNQWAEGLVEHDIDLFLATISESFSAPQAPDKQALGDFIEQAMFAGYVDDAEIIFDDAQFTMGEDTCSVYPVDLMSVAGGVAVELILTRENGEWLITGMEIDGV